MDTTAYDEARQQEDRAAQLLAHPETIEVGEGVTMRTGMGGLYVAFTVIGTRRNGRELIIQSDEVVNLTQGDPWQDNGEKEFRPDPNGPTRVITLRKDTTYIEKGHPKEWYSTRYYVGSRRDWTDLSQ